MQINDTKVKSLADDLSLIVLNKVLSREINIQEALQGISLSMLYMIGKSLPEQQFKEQFRSTEPLSVALVDTITELYREGKEYNITQILIALNNVIDFAIEKVVEQN